MNKPKEKQDAKLLPQIRRLVAMACDYGDPDIVLRLGALTSITRLRQLTVFIMITATSCTYQEASTATGTIQPSAAFLSYQKVARKLTTPEHKKVLSLAQSGKYAVTARTIKEMLDQKETWLAPSRRERGIPDLLRH